MIRTRFERARYRVFTTLIRVAFPVRGRSDLEKLGSAQGGHIVPTSLLSPASICWCAGVGEDISFDLELIRRFDCQVWAVDPTPRSARHVHEMASNEPSYHFLPVGLWHEDRVMPFYDSAGSEDVSHSVLNIQRTKSYFEARCRPLDVLVAEAGHDRVDLLKMDIEGAEYSVLEHLRRTRLLPRIVVVEFHHFEPRRLWTRLLPRIVLTEFQHLLAWLRIRTTVRAMLNAGYVLVAVDGWHFTLVFGGTTPFPDTPNLPHPCPER